MWIRSLELLSLLCGLLRCLVNEAAEADIVLANMLHNLPVRPQLEVQLCLPWLGICLRVVDRQVDLQGVVVNAPDAFNKVHGVAVWITFPIECGLVVKTDRIGNERISLPLANRVAHPQRAQLFVMRAPVCVDSAHEVIELEEHDHLTWNLDDLHWKVEKIDPRHTRWKATENRITQYGAWAGTAEYGIGRLKFRLCPRRHRGDRIAKIKIE